MEMDQRGLYNGGKPPQEEGWEKYQKRDTEQDLLQHWEEQPI